ncbi:transposase, partial [Corynebacterium belfantii]|uniref:transposase n=1 Tax=Corynebacterium belfantii TaxID=2014537 RepID=UPI001F369F87
RVLYTTNSIESLNAELRKATRNRGQFPNDTAALKTLWLMICSIEDRRVVKRVKQGKRVSVTVGRLMEGGECPIVCVRGAWFTSSPRIGRGKPRLVG